MTILLIIAVLVCGIAAPAQPVQTIYNLDASIGI